MTKKEMIDYIISNGSLTGYAEDNRATLDTMTDCAVGKIYGLAEKVVANSKQDPPVKGVEPLSSSKQDPLAMELSSSQSIVPPVVQSEKPLTVEQFMKMIPTEIQVAFTSMMEAGKANKTIMISNIMKVDPSWKKEELETLSQNTLGKVFNSLSIGVNFAGNPGGPTPDLVNNDLYTPAPKLWENV